MIKEAILNKTRLGHKVNPLKDGRVYVFGERAFKQAKSLEAEGKIEFINMFEPARGRHSSVFQGICIVKEQ